MAVIAVEGVIGTSNEFVRKQIDRVRDDEAVVAVVDHGIGIPARELATLGTRFFRASNARRSRIPGTGLGLAGVKALVDRFEGALEVASEEHVGSRFTVCLPLCC